MSIQIFATKRYRFRNPGVSNAELMAQPNSATLSNAFFDAEPKVFLDAPDWIQQDQLFEWAQADGSLRVVASAAKPKSPAKAEDKTDEAKAK